MAGPLTFKVTDRMSCTAPPLAVKEWTDTSMFIFDFKNWLGPEQHLVAASDVAVQFNPQVKAGSWAPFNGCCRNSCNDDSSTAVDLNPITLEALEFMPGGTRVEISLGGGTPGFSYLASFFTSAGPFPRRKEVAVLVSVNGVVGPVAPGPDHPAPGIFNIYSSTTLPDGASGDINIMVGGITITMPGNPYAGQFLNFKDVSGVASGAVITIAGGISGALIDGQPSLFMFQDYQAEQLYWTGTGWGVR